MTDPRIPSEPVSIQIMEAISALTWACKYSPETERAARAALVQAIAEAIAQARTDERRSLMIAYALGRSKRAPVDAAESKP